jgi:hypothetical protein
MKKILFVLDIIAVAIYSILSYFVVKYDEALDVVTDGLGRVIVEPPIFLQLYLQIDRWVGLGWYIVDIIVFWVGIGIAIKLYKD